MADKGFDLSLEPYCDYCPSFEPDVEKTEITKPVDLEKKVRTTIRCKYRGICKRICLRMD